MESPAKRSRESRRNRSAPDLNNMEHVNAQLKSKLKILTVEMKDAVEKMNSMTEEMNTIRNENLICKDRLAEVEQENALLISQIEEMANERAERDAILEEFSSAVEARIVECKEIFDKKDSTITKLKENLLYITSDRRENASPDENNQVEIEQLIQDIDRRDEIIAELQAKLSEAVVEINESSLLIEKFKSDGKTDRKSTTKRSSKEQREMEKKIQDANKRISTLESLLESAERDAKVKSEQLCEALSILSKYEDENTSLTEALDEIKDLKGQIERKNKHVEDLVVVLNRLEMENSRFEEAIVVLRDKLGITEEEEESSLEDLILQRKRAQEDKIDEIRRSYDKLSSENVDLKFQIRKLKSALKESMKQKLVKTNGISSDGEQIEDISHRSESKKEFVELKRIKENVKCVIEENEALRQGMHEILDCIHHQDGKSIVTIQSQTLENLLEALDARNLAGWYHPAMRLQGRVNYLQGSNAELRAQLQQIRKNQLMLQIEMQQRASSVEEGECSQSQSLMHNNALDDKMESPSYSRNVTPKSITSVLSQNADSGRASGKAVDIDDMQQTDAYMDREQSQSLGDSPTEDEGFGKKSEEIYAMAKEIITQESEFKNALNDAEKVQKVLESQITILRKKLANSISSDEFSDLRDKYLESNMRLRAAFETKFLTNGDETRDVEAAKHRAMQELRDELVSVHKQLSDFTLNNHSTELKTDSKNIEEMENIIAELKAENERLQKAAEIAREEASIHRAIDSTVLTEFNELRQRILKFEMDDGQEIKETARLSLELANYKVIGTELREQKRIMEGELMRAREELAQLKKRQNADKEFDEQIDKQSDFRGFIEIIDFLQHQYASSTSLSSWVRYEACLDKLNNERNEAKELITQINERNESLKIQQETLTNRLRVVEQLKDMLEQQIGSNDVQDIMQKFTAESRQALSESKYKMQISQLEEAVQKANANLSDYESKIETMEREMNRVQRAWKVQKTSTTKKSMSVDKVTETDPIGREKKYFKPTATKAAQTEFNTRSTESQCSLCCKTNAISYLKTHDETDKKQKETVEKSELEDIAPENEEDDPSEAANVALLQEQLGQALTLASERSVAMSKLEAQVAEYRTKITALTRLLDEKNNLSAANYSSDEPTKDRESPNRRGGASFEASQSTITALEKIIAQKEEIIVRRQIQLKEDRDKHSETTTRLHEEIKKLKNRIALAGLSISIDNTLTTDSENLEKDSSVIGTARTEGRTDEVSMLKEKITRLETELNVNADLAERWHRLAEDRLRHMDSTRERLEEQHREEIHSYRTELNQRQHEVDELRRQLLDLRRLPTTKTEVHSFIKALQIKDNKLADEIETELEEHAASERQRLSTTYSVEDARSCACDQLHSQVDGLRRQLQVHKEREKAYKNEIAELQQKLSKRYMAIRTQEKRASKREMQLEKKVKELEEELHETREILDRHYMVQQIKRAKTAEDLGLWEKCKKWQQTAERLKEKLREKTEECQRLQSNYEKLRNLISCMEREKWYLRGKCRSESVTQVPVWLPTPDVPQPNNHALVEDLQRECQELRDRVTELVARLHCRDNEKACQKLASVAIEEEECLNAEVKDIKNTLEEVEKENLKLEAENFEIRLELERAHVNTPRYEEKIQHLEKYIELLKSEIPVESNYSSPAPRRDGSQRTKLELERTVCTLKKLVEKLQFENKKLRNSLDQVDNIESQCNCMHLRQEYEQALERISGLEMDLELAQKRIALMQEAAAEKSSDEDGSEVAVLKQKLRQKSQLLLKVKDLLAKAAINEKVLRKEIQQLEFKQTLSVIPECATPLGMPYS